MVWPRQCWLPVLAKLMSYLNRCCPNFFRGKSGDAGMCLHPRSFLLALVFFVLLVLILIPLFTKFVVSGVTTDPYSWRVDDR